MTFIKMNHMWEEVLLTEVKHKLCLSMSQGASTLDKFRNDRWCIDVNKPLFQFQRVKGPKSYSMSPASKRTKWEESLA
jgi:hypothetical protein